MPNQEISWIELLTFLSPEGQQQLIDFVRAAKETRGENWLPEIKREFPMFCWIVELIANRTADEAFIEVKNAFPHLPLSIVEGKLKTLHGRLLYEIERPR